ncbi:MAG: DUF87 domain-containing protein [bacterium]
MLWQLTTAIPDEITFNIGAREVSMNVSVFVIIFLGIIVSAVVVAYIFRYFYRKETNLQTSLKKVILKITVPKESSAKHVEDRPTTADDIKSQISSMEAFLSILGGLKVQKSWLRGREDTFSLEIVAHQGIIVFYLATPHDIKEYVEQQLQAQFPESNIEKIIDYNIFTRIGYAAGSSLILSRRSMFPIKTYTKMDVDPLNAITNVLSKMEQNDGALIQIMIRSAQKKWHREGTEVAQQMQQGKTLKDAIASSGWGLKKFFKDMVKIIWESFFPRLKRGQGSESLDDKPHQLSPMETEIIKGLEEKTSKAGLDVNIRIVVSASNDTKAQRYLKNIIDTFNQYSIYQYGNSFKKYELKTDRIVFDAIHRLFDERRDFVLNSEELASIYHFPLPTTETPNIAWMTAKKAQPPVNMPKEGIILGESFFRGKKILVKIEDDDRRRHMYVIGKSGTGKSFFLANMARQDIANGKGVCVIDPHGDLIDDVLARVPKERADDVIVFDPSDTQRPMGLNLIEYDPNYPEQKTFVVNELIKIFDKLYDLKQTGGPMFEQYMRSALLLILDDPKDEATLMDVSRVLADVDYRKKKLAKCQNQVVKDFWTKEAEKAGGEASLANMVPYITSKLNQFVSNDIMRPIIGQKKSVLNFRKAMDESKIVLVKLSKGSIGELNAYLLGMVVVGKILMSALSRTDIPKEQRKDFYLYIDEFQNFTTDSIAIILSEARKYMLNLIIAHQYIGQLVKGQDTSIRDAVFGNVGTIISFKIGVEDADTFAKEFAPVFDEYDVINVEKYTAYIKLLINNEASRAFNMNTFLLEKGDSALAKKIIKMSRLKYGRDRQAVEAEILTSIKGFSAGGGGESDMNFK